MFKRKILVAALFFAGLATVPAAPACAADSKPHVDLKAGNLQPAYPATAIPNQESGAVVVYATVSADGTVRKVALQQSSGFADLDTAAINAVKGWKFVPAMDGGEAVEGTTSVQIVSHRRSEERR